MKLSNSGVHSGFARSEMYVSELTFGRLVYWFWHPNSGSPKFF